MKTRHKGIAAYAKKVRQTTKIVVRVHNTEVNELGEMYYLAVAMGHAYRNKKTQYVGTNKINKGTWIVSVRWLHFQQHKTASVPGNCYSFKPNEPEVIFPLVGTIPSAFEFAQKLTFKKSDSCFILPKVSHEDILATATELLS